MIPTKMPNERSMDDLVLKGKYAEHYLRTIAQPATFEIHGYFRKLTGSSQKTDTGYPKVMH